MTQQAETTTVAAAKKDTAPEAEVKKEVKKEAPKSNGGGGGGASKKMSVADMARALLKKHAGLETVKPSFSTLPHVPSGSVVMNNLIGGSKASDGKGAVCPGYPRKRITELYGAESCGKTTMALAAAIECQKSGGVVAFLDFEHALVDGYARAIGLDYHKDKLILAKPDTLEQGMKAMYLLIRTGVDLIIIDSVASMIPKDELEKDTNDPERIGSLAGPLTRFLKKLVIWLDRGPDDKTRQGAAVIFINQTRVKFSTSGGGGYGGDEDQTPGGKALKFYSSLRLRMTRIKSEVIKKKDPLTGKEKSHPYGNVTSIRVVKTKIDLKQGQEGVIFIRYGQGLDNLYSIIENGIRFKLIKREGAYFSYDGQRIQGREVFRKLLIDNPDMTKTLTDKVTEAMFSSAVEVKKSEEDDEADVQEAEYRAEFGDDDTLGGDSEPELSETLNDEEG